MTPAPLAAGDAGRTRVLVLGASGFIGRRIVTALAGSDWAMPVAASRRPGAPGSGPLATLRLDARDAAAMAGALRGIDAVVNCVAGDSSSIVTGAQVLFAAATARTPAPRIVHLSTMQVYGTTPGPVDENSALRGDWDSYSAAKVQAESLAQGCPSAVILRPGIVYGPGSPIWSGDVARWLQAGRLGDLGEAGAGTCNLVHVDDVVAAVLRCLRLPGVGGQAFNLCAPEPPTWNAYFRDYAQALGARYVRVSALQLRADVLLAGPALKVAQIIAQRGRLAWRPPPPLRPWFLRLCAQTLRLEAGKAERELGLQWTPLAQGLHDAAAALAGAAGAP